MATSGSKNFSVTRSEIIAAALRKCGSYDQGEAVPADEEAAAAFALNLLVKEWSTFGIDIFVRQQVTVLLSENRPIYYLGNEAQTSHDDLILLGQHSTSALTSAYVGLNASISTTEGAGPIWITGKTEGSVTSDSGVIVHQGFKEALCAIQLDTGKWVRARCTSVEDKVGAESVSFVNSSGQVGDTAAIGNTVRFAEGRKTSSDQHGLAARPERILYAHRRDPVSGNDVPVSLIGENEFQSLNLKSLEGPTYNIWYKPLSEYGELHVWPTGGNTTYTELVLQCQFYADDMDSVSNNPQFPIEWANALIFNLAHDMAPEYGVDRQTRADMFIIGQRKLQEQLDNNIENANVVFSLDQRMQGAQ